MLDLFETFKNNSFVVILTNKNIIRFLEKSKVEKKKVKKMPNKEIKIILTKSYLKSLDKIKDPVMRIAIEKKVNKLLENPNIAQPMSYQHEGFCEIDVGKKYRVYCIRLEGVIIVFIMATALHHKKNYKKSKEYERLFEQLRKVKKEFKE